MTSTLRIAMIDDHQIVLDGLKLLLQDEPGFTIVAECSRGEDMLAEFDRQPIDILLTDVMMPGMNGPELCRRVRAAFPLVKILALSMSGQGEMVRELIEDADINGYLLKNVGRAELVAAIKKIAEGGQYFSEQVLNEMEKLSATAKSEATVQLTNREIDVIKCIEKEMSNKEIAETLFISERTVETHRKNIFRKTGANGVVGLIKYAYEHKLI
jgi:two-component system, NarL family, nitrate/nitrite response regulator NarL